MSRGTSAGETMAGVVHEAWLATAELDEVADAETRKSAFMLVLEAMLSDADSDSSEAIALHEDLDRYEVRQPEEDDLFTSPQLRCGEIAHYLRIPSKDAETMFDASRRAPEPAVGSELLSESKQRASCEIALLTIAGRTAVGLETVAEQICRALARYQLPGAESFDSDLVLRDDCLMSSIENRNGGELRLTSEGVEAVRELAQRLASR
jgi:hypothetical protein